MAERIVDLSARPRADRPPSRRVTSNVDASWSWTVLRWATRITMGPPLISNTARQSPWRRRLPTSPSPVAAWQAG